MCVSVHVCSCCNRVFVSLNGSEDSIKCAKRSRFKPMITAAEAVTVTAAVAAVVGSSERRHFAVDFLVLLILDGCYIEKR